MPQIVARSKNSIWTSHLYYNSSRTVLLNSTNILHKISASLLRCLEASRLLQSFTLHMWPQPTSRRSQTQTGWEQTTPEPMSVRVKRYFLADYNSFSPDMPWSTVYCDRRQNVDSLNFCACRIIHSQPVFENLHTQLRHFSMHASGDFFPPKLARLWLNYNSFLHSFLNV